MARVNVLNHDHTTTDHRALVGWFDADKATEYREATRWDGNNLVSVNDVGRYGHQILYRTAGGRWVLYTWSEWSGVEPRYEFIPAEAAREWLLLNEEDSAVAQHFGPVEDERGPGRPEVGGLINVRLGDALPRVIQYADTERISQAEAVRRLVAVGLAARST